MTETEKKALALVNEARAAWGRHRTNVFIRGDDDKIEALCRAIEQHEAFRQEVSDAVADAKRTYGGHRQAFDQLERFIIAKPDPLVEALDDLKDGRAGPTTESYAACLRAAIEARGGRIVWEGE